MSSVLHSGNAAKQHRRARSVHRREDPPSAHTKRSFWSRYWFELLVTGLFATGIFLLVEQMEIKATLWAIARQGWHLLVAVGHRFMESGFGLLGTVETSDLVGIGLILLACALVYWRLRERCVGPYDDQEEPRDCPNCGHHLDRVHRTPVQRIVSLLLWARIRRYLCTNCGFQTKTVRRPHGA